MKKFKKPHILLLGIGGFLVVLLFLLPRTGEVVEKTKPEPVAKAVSYTERYLGELDESSRSDWDAIQRRIEAENDPLEKINWYDSLSKFWDARGAMIMSGDALTEVAELLQDKPSWFIAGDKYFEAFQADTTETRRTAIEKAIASYEKVRNLNPDDLEAATSLGVCYVEGSQVLGEPPMKGIQMLRDVLQKDPENINALVNLGYFAVKSGQYDKAIERFEDILRIQPDYVEAFLYLSDIYVRKGEVNKAIEQLEKYKKFVNDPEAMKQLDVYIEKLKSNNV